jgi:protein downstream neighbor of Son
MKIQLRKKQLANRLKQQAPTENKRTDNKFPIPTNQKRCNPFMRDSAQDQKRSRTSEDFEIEDSIFELIHNTKSKPTPNIEALTPDEIIKHATQYISSDDEDEEQPKEEIVTAVTVPPIDWSLKSKVRILAPSMIVANTLTGGVKASGITGFVRCLDITTTSIGLDTSDSSRLYQNEMYWQYPHIPWLNLVNRNLSSNSDYKINEKEADELFKDWSESFTNLFQLLRARQCCYFYVIANQYSVLFRAAGIGGRVEHHAILTPTTKGFRKILKQEEIDFTQPLKSLSKKSMTPNTSLENIENKNPDKNEECEDEEEEEEEDEMQFLASLGVNTSDIKFKEDVKKKQLELEDDHGDLSTALFEGADCIAFANYLLEAKSTIPKVGRLAGVPPTLISPVAFLGGTLRKQNMRCSKVRENGTDFHSVELSGAILPHTIHTLTALLSEMKENYSMTMANFISTIAFTKVSRKLLENLDTSQSHADHVFGRENLTGTSGLPSYVLDAMCKVEANAVNFLERLQFSREKGGFTFN